MEIKGVQHGRKLKLEVTFDAPQEQQVFTELFQLLVEGISQRLNSTPENFYGEEVKSWEQAQYDPKDFH